MAAVVLLSGGLDSAVNLKVALDETGVALALTFDYGQRAARREGAAAALMCQRLGVAHELVQLPWLAEICGTSLVSEGQPIPRLRPEELEEKRVRSGETAAAVWVPNRNGAFVNIGAAFAESLGAAMVVAGFNAEEAATFPDNGREFVAAANAALALSTRSGVRLLSYTQELTKVEIVRMGRAVGAPIDCVWSCYRGGGEECRECESCARLERALRGEGAWEWFQRNRLVP